MCGVSTRVPVGVLSFLFFSVLPICNLLRGISRNGDRHSFQEKPFEQDRSECRLHPV